MHNISGIHIVPNNDIGAPNKNHLQHTASPKGRLEDLLNDLISMNETPEDAQSAAPIAPAYQQGLPSQSQNWQAPPLADFSFSSTAAPSYARPTQSAPGSINFGALGRKPLPQALRAMLKLPVANIDGVFAALKNFQQGNRHKPLVELPCGLIAYVEYDLESDRIRLFLGSKSEFMTFSRGVREQSAILVIDEVFEYKVETQIKDFLGFKKKEQTVNEKHKHGSELLRGNDLIPGRKVYPVLHFSMFADKSCGISSCAVKAECLNR